MTTNNGSSSGGEIAIPNTFKDGQKLPRILVFDLDYTLWPFWIDTHVLPPIKTKGDKFAVDSSGETLQFYKDVPDILAAAHAQGIPLALASRTCTPDLAENLLKLLKVKVSSVDGKATTMRAWDLFRYRQIYPGDKKTHLKRIEKTAGVDFSDILFFDDEPRNQNVESLGVRFWLVRDGISRAEVDRGINHWREQANCE